MPAGRNFKRKLKVFRLADWADFRAGTFFSRYGCAPSLLRQPGYIVCDYQASRGLGVRGCNVLAIWHDVEAVGIKVLRGGNKNLSRSPCSRQEILPHDVVSTVNDVDDRMAVVKEAGTLTVDVKVDRSTVFQSDNVDRADQGAGHYVIKHVLTIWTDIGPCSRPGDNLLRISAVCADLPHSRML